MRPPRTRSFWRRLLAALAETTPAFSRVAQSDEWNNKHRLLAALAETTPAFTPGGVDRHIGRVDADVHRAALRRPRVLLYVAAGVVIVILMAAAVIADSRLSSRPAWPSVPNRGPTLVTTTAPVTTSAEATTRNPAAPYSPATECEPGQYGRAPIHTNGSTSNPRWGWAYTAHSKACSHWGGVALDQVLPDGYQVKVTFTRYLYGEVLDQRYCDINPGNKYCSTPGIHAEACKWTYRTTAIISRLTGTATVTVAESTDDELLEHSCIS
jgi:hypothetical protein